MSPAQVQLNRRRRLDHNALFIVVVVLGIAVAPSYFFVVKRRRRADPDVRAAEVLFLVRGAGAHALFGRRRLEVLLERRISF